MIPIPVDAGALAGWGVFGAVILGACLWIWNLWRKSERGERDRAANEILGKDNASLRGSIMEREKREEQYDQVENRILNDPDSVDTDRLLNSYDYLGEIPEAGEIQQDDGARRRPVR